MKTVSKFASSETLEYNRKEDIVEIFLLRMGDGLVRFVESTILSCNC